MNPQPDHSPGRVARLYRPRPIEVATDRRGTPTQVNGSDVVSIREEWLVEDGWWTTAPIRRWYFELVLIDGRDLTLFRAFPSGEWFAQRA